MSTIADVAARAGVSKATASRGEPCLAEMLEERRSKLSPPESFGLGSGHPDGRQPPSIGR